MMKLSSLNKINDRYGINSKSVYNSEVAWTEGNLYYQFMHILDMEYLDAYRVNDWNTMYKVFEIRFMKSKVYIQKYATKQQWNILVEQNNIKSVLMHLKQGESDYINQFNDSKIKMVLDIIKQKMDILEELRSKAGMNLLLNKIQEYKPAALGNDDF